MSTTDELDGFDLRPDSWASMVTGLGTLLDKSQSLFYQRAVRLDAATVDALYDEGGLFARCIDIPADDMTRVDFTIETPGAAFNWSEVKADVDRWCTLRHTGDSIRWSRLYGGTLLVAQVDDGRNPELPLDLGSVRAFVKFVEVESDFATPAKGPIDNPMTWRIGGTGADTLGTREVHRSRVFRFDGVRTSPGARVRYGKNGWGPSVGDRVFESLKRLEAATGYAANIMHELSLPVLKVAGLRKMLANPQSGRADVQAVLQSIKDSIDILHMLAIDSADEFVDVTRETRGLVELHGIFERVFNWGTDVPREILFHEVEGGLNTGELAGPMRAWYDRVAKRRKDVVDPVVMFAIDVSCAVRKLKPPASRVLEWDPLWQPTETERATTAATWATADRAYFDMGAITEDEIRRARFVNTQDGGFAVDDDDDGEELGNLVALPGGAGAPIEAPPADPEASGPPPPTIDVDKALAIMKAAQANEIPREGAIALLRVAFPQLAPELERLVPPPPPPADPNAVAPDDPMLEAADYDPPDVPLFSNEIKAQLGISPAVLRGMHKRGEIGAWKFGARWKYSPSEVKQAGYRPPVTPTPTDPQGGTPSSSVPPAVGAPPA